MTYRAHLGLELPREDQVFSRVDRMPKRVRIIKRLLFRLLAAASLLIAPLLFWGGLPLLHGFVSETSTQTELSAQAFVDDAEWDGCPEETRPASQARLRAGRLGGQARRVSAQMTEQARVIRFALVVDVRRVKPKRLLAPPYLRPRVLRLLS